MRCDRRQPTKAATAKACGTNADNQTWRNAWKALEDAGCIVQTPQGWDATVTPDGEPSI